MSSVASKSKDLFDDRLKAHSEPKVRPSKVDAAFVEVTCAFMENTFRSCCKHLSKSLCVLHGHQRVGQL